MKKSGAALLSAFLALSACGGSDNVGIGGSTSGFYSLSVSLQDAEITSPAVEVVQRSGGEGGSGGGSLNIPEIKLPQDVIAGSIRLSYNGLSNTPMRATVQSAKLCLRFDQEKCYNLPISGVLVANGNPLQFNVSLSDYKTKLPWVQVNPYEDAIIQTGFRSENLTGASTPVSQNDSYFNTKRTVILAQVPVQAGSVRISANGVFSGQAVGSTDASGSLSLNLPKGITTANQLVPGTVRVVVGNITCLDDGNGGFSAPCVGTVDYAAGRINVAGLPANANATVSYRFNGGLLCMDSVSGSWSGDCVSDDTSINYSTGQLSYRFSFNAVSVPQAVQIDYAKAVASGNVITHNLPAPTSLAPFVYRVAGRVVEVYQGNTKLCDRSVAGACTVQVQGSTVAVMFQSTAPQNLTLRYSEDIKVDVSPGIDVEQVGRLPNATVPAYLEVKVRLDSGESLTARASLTFRVVPNR